VLQAPGNIRRLFPATASYIAQPALSLVRPYSAQQQKTRPTDFTESIHDSLYQATETENLYTTPYRSEVQSAKIICMINTFVDSSPGVCLTLLASLTTLYNSSGCVHVCIPVASTLSTPLLRTI